MIDPKRLTEADKGRAVLWLDSPVPPQPLMGWDEESVMLKCACCSQTFARPASRCIFVAGTYQDGGPE